jgi:hypothetical protein
MISMRFLILPSKCTKSIDLREKMPPIGPVRFLRAEWKTLDARFILVWYEIDGVEQSLALRLDLDKRVFLDDPSVSDVCVIRAVKAHAGDVVRQVAAYRQTVVSQAIARAAAAGA